MPMGGLHDVHHRAKDREHGCGSNVGDSDDAQDREAVRRESQDLVMHMHNGFLLQCLREVSGLPRTNPGDRKDPGVHPPFNRTYRFTKMQILTTHFSVEPLMGPYGSHRIDSTSIKN